LKNLFARNPRRNKDQPNDPPPGQETPGGGAESGSENPAPAIRLEPPQLLYGAGQSVGIERYENEDALFATSLLLASGLRQERMGFFLVADGMGGHQHGKEASHAAARVMTGTVLGKITPGILQSDPAQAAGSLQETLLEGIQEAQKAVLEAAPGGGTTLTAALVLGDNVTIGHVGDSRAYFYSREGEITRLTDDHTLVQRLQDLGQLTESESREHPYRNVLYQALGQDEPLQPDIKTLHFKQPGALLLCSDGLWGVVSEKKLFGLIDWTRHPAEVCQEMVQMANEAGGPDNISVILVYLL
jgi:serine/threonine protein phosphatase PrpC